MKFNFFVLGYILQQHAISLIIYCLSRQLNDSYKFIFK